jgi:hypothetical protein
MSCLLWFDEDDENYKDKLEQLKKVSNPKEVIKNAQQYFNDPDIKVYLSKRKDKKYAIYDPNTKKLVHFGNVNYEDYTKHKNEERRLNYLNRTANIRGSWKNDKYSANNLARILLWDADF